MVESGLLHTQPLTNIRFHFTVIVECFTSKCDSPVFETSSSTRAVFTSARDVVGGPVRSLSRMSFRQFSNPLHHLMKWCTLITVSPHISSSWLWISSGEICFAHKYGITFELLRRTKSLISLPLKINLYPQLHQADCAICCMLTQLQVLTSADI